MAKLQEDIKNRIQEELLSTVGRKYRNETFWIIFLSLICVGGTVAWIIQLKKGLGVTAMRDYASWGLYISLLFFWLSLIAAGIVKAIGQENNTVFQLVMLKLAPWFRVFTGSGIVLFAGSVIIVVPLFKIFLLRSSGRKLL